MTSLLSVIALIAIADAYKLDPIADLPIVRPVATAAILTFGIVSLLDPEAAGIGSAWLVDQYVTEAADLAAWITERVLGSNPYANPT